MVNYIEGNRTISLGRGEIPITPVTPSCAERCYPASNFLLGHFRVFGIFFGILFTKNALQSVLQGISAERARKALVEKDILDNIAGVYYFQDPVYAYWLKHHYFML